MTSGRALQVDHPTRVRVNPHHGDKVRIFEVKMQGNETVLEKFDQYVKAGGTVTLVEVSDCTVNNCPCRIGKIAGGDMRRVFAIVLDEEVDIEPVN